VLCAIKFLEQIHGLTSTSAKQQFTTEAFPENRYAPKLPCGAISWLGWRVDVNKPSLSLLSGNLTKP